MDPEAADDGRLLCRFRRAFALLWLLHDLADWATDASLPLFLAEVPRTYWVLRTALFAALLGFGGGMLLCRRHVFKWCCGALLARAVQAACFTPLNDFSYVCVVTLLLACSTQSPPHPRLSWMRLLSLQTAWIYFATGLLKLSPAWLSGDHLWVRQNYLRLVRHWPYPPVYAACVEALSCNRLLAWAGAGAELGLALLIAGMPLRRGAGRGRRAAALALAAGVHGFGALATDVWFFGASMLLQLGFICRASRRP